MKTPYFLSAVLRLSFVCLFFFTQTNITYSQSWDYVGTPDISDGIVGNISIAFNNNTPYLAYTEGSNGNKATVKKFDGTNWVTVGNAGFSAGSAPYTNIVFNGNTPYVAFRDVGNNNRTTVMKFDGANWVPVGSPGFTSRQAWFAPLAFEGSTPYVGYWDGGSINKATVKKFDGTNWVIVGTEGFSAGVPVNIAIAFVGTTPYVCYRDDALNFIVVKKFDGTNWVTVGPDPGVSATSSDYPSFVVHSGIPYVAYRDDASNRMVTVKKFDGVNWVTVGSPGFSRGAASTHSLAFNGNTPYLLFAEGLGKATLMKFDGANWVLEGPQGFSAGSTSYLSLAFNGGIAYAAYMDNSLNKAVVAKFITTPLPVKLLSFSATKTADMNLLKWTTTEEINTGNFDVERSTGHGFDKIGFVKAAGNSGIEKQYAFEDRQPFAGTNHYRLKMVDLDGHAEYSTIVTLKSDGRTGISVHPNPVQSKLYVEGAGNGVIYQIKNTSGQVVTSGRLNAEGINLSRLLSGVYVLEVNGMPFKFIKQ
jgi:hypothetical protein